MFALIAVMSTAAAVCARGSDTLKPLSWEDLLRNANEGTFVVLFLAFLVFTHADK